MDDIKWFVGLLVIFGVLWIGGKTKSRDRVPETATSTPKTQVVRPPAQKVQKEFSAPAKQESSTGFPPAGTIISESTLPETVDEQNSTISPLQGALTIGSISRGNSAEKEYVVIVASGRNTDDINITGLTIRSRVSFNGHKIGKGWTMYFPQTSGEGEPILLRPSGRAFVLSGRSPIQLPNDKAVSSLPQSGGFQLNRCTGFFEQGLNFYPSLPIECPRPVDEPLPVAPNTLSDNCYDYLKTIRRCTVPSAVPEKLRTDGSCQAHIFNRINYNQCVVDNKNSPSFFRGEWRIYLGRSSKLWRDRHDIVELVDQDGKLIDTRGY